MKNGEEGRGENDLTKRKTKSVLLWNKRQKPKEKTQGEPNDGKKAQNRQMRKIVVKATHMKKRVHTHKTQMY